MESRQKFNILPLFFLFLALCVFAFNVRQHFFLGDDGFISFRYAKNLVLGHGLVWNEGYRVEGYTNFLWVLLIAAGMYVGLEPEWFAPFLSIIAGVLFLLTYMVWLLRRHGPMGVGVWAPVFVLCFNRSFTGWVTGGLETMLHVCLIFWGVVLIVKAHEEQEKTPRGAAICFALATLTRPDSIVFAFTAGCVLLFDAVFGKRPLKTVFFWTVLYFTPVLLHVAWRYSYYGYLLPNTFYAKVAGLWLTQSYHYFALFHRFYQILWFVPFILIAYFSKFRYEARYFLFLSAVYLAYIVYVGGDRFEFRFLVVVFPYLYWLLVEGARVLCFQWGAVVAGKSAQYLAMGGIVCALMACNMYGSVIEVPKSERHGVAPIRGIKKYATSRTEQGLFVKSLIDKGLYPKDLPMALGGAGAVPYYTMLPVLDRRGLNNVEIAHMPIKKRGRVAHEHDAPIEYLIEKEIAVFDIFNRIYHSDLEKLNDGKMYHDGHTVRVRALRGPGGYLIFGTFVSDERLHELFPKLELILPDWEQKRAAEALAAKEIESDQVKDETAAQEKDDTSQPSASVSAQDAS